MVSGELVPGELPLVVKTRDSFFQTDFLLQGEKRISKYIFQGTSLTYA